MSGGIITRGQINKRIANDQFITNIPEPKDGGISTGPTICGYDITLDTAFLSITVNSATLSPKYMGRKFFGGAHREKSFNVGPGDILTAQSVEIFNMPNDLIAVAHQRAVYNNFGLSINMPPLLPGYVGRARFTITNFSKNGIRVYPGEGICTLMFHTVSFEDDEAGELYSGKYNDQDTITVVPPVVKP